MRRETWLDIEVDTSGLVAVALGPGAGTGTGRDRQRQGPGGGRHIGAVSLLSPLLPAPPKFFPSLKLGIARPTSCLVKSALLKTCYQRHTTQPESPSRTITCPIMRRKTVPHRQVQLAISTYGNNGCGTWTVEEKTWSNIRCYYVKIAKFDTAKPGEESYRPS